METEAVDVAVAVARKLCSAMIAERRENPTDDLTSVLVHAEIDGQRLEEHEIVMGFFLLVAAGNDSTKATYSSAMRAFTGIWATGMISQMLQMNTKLNSVSRNGVQPIPSLPIVCRMIPSRTNSTTDSATFCTSSSGPYSARRSRPPAKPTNG